MNVCSKVIWSEGLFLRPQHLQQQERYFAHMLGLRAGQLSAYYWGFSALQLDKDLLSIGKVGIARAQGCFQDGTAFSIPEHAPAPLPIDIAKDTSDQTVFLVLPQRQGTESECFWPDADADVPTKRYVARSVTVHDSSGSTQHAAHLEVGALSTRLQLSSVSGEGFVRLPVARITTCRADLRVELDDTFLPSLLRVECAPWLVGFLSELLGMLHQRGQALADRLTGTSTSSGADVADMLLLQVINRILPLVAYWSQCPFLHPEVLYQHLVMLAGELATFTTTEKRSARFPHYTHDTPADCFTPIVQSLRQSLATVLEQTAISLPVRLRQYGVWVAHIPDLSLLDSASFILAISADVAKDTLRQRLPTEAKIGSVEKIRDLVNLQLPGIGVSALPMAPRQVPFYANSVYFELDRTSTFWKNLKTSGGMALHFGSAFPALELHVWAVRNAL